MKRALRGRGRPGHYGARSERRPERGPMKAVIMKSRTGLGYRVRQAGARPRNTTVRDLMSDERCTYSKYSSCRDPFGLHMTGQI